MSSPKLRYVLFMRHATAATNFDMMQDFDRPLTREGLAEAARIGKNLSELSSCPSFTVFCSEALRARQTLEVLQESGVVADAVHFEPIYYQARVEQVLESLWTVSDKVQSLLVIGHNPTWSQLIAYLTGSIVALSPANAVLMSRKVNSWSLGLSSPGWHIERRFEP